MKAIKLYIDEAFIKEKLGTGYENSNITFTKADVGTDNTVTFTCLISDESIDSYDVTRTKII